MKQHILILLGLAVLCLQSASADNWQIIASPNGSRQVNELHGVSALAENDVWAVGVSYNTERPLGSTLIEHWNGSRWSVVPSQKSQLFREQPKRGRGGLAERCLGSGDAPTSTNAPKSGLRELLEEGLLQFSETPGKKR